MAIYAKISLYFYNFKWKRLFKNVLKTARKFQPHFQIILLPTLPLPTRSFLSYLCKKYALETEWKGRIILVIWIVRKIIFSTFSNEKYKWPDSKPPSQLLIRLMYWLTSFPSWVGGESNSIWQNVSHLLTSSLTSLIRKPFNDKNFSGLEILSSQLHLTILIFYVKHPGSIALIISLCPIPFFLWLKGWHKETNCFGFTIEDWFSKGHFTS